MRSTSRSHGRHPGPVGAALAFEWMHPPSHTHSGTGHSCLSIFTQPTLQPGVLPPDPTWPGQPPLPRASPARKPGLHHDQSACGPIFSPKHSPARRFAMFGPPGLGPLTPGSSCLISARAAARAVQFEEPVAVHPDHAARASGHPALAAILCVIGSGLR